MSNIGLNSSERITREFLWSLTTKTNEGEHLWSKIHLDDLKEEVSNELLANDEFLEVFAFSEQESFSMYYSKYKKYDLYLACKSEGGVNRYLMLVGENTFCMVNQEFNYYNEYLEPDYECKYELFTMLDSSKTDDGSIYFDYILLEFGIQNEQKYVLSDHSKAIINEYLSENN